LREEKAAANTSPEGISRKTLFLLEKVQVWGGLTAVKGAQSAFCFAKWPKATLRQRHTRKMLGLARSNPCWNDLPAGEAIFVFSCRVAATWRSSRGKEVGGARPHRKGDVEHQQMRNRGRSGNRSGFPEKSRRPTTSASAHNARDQGRALERAFATYAHIQRAHISGA
jgi:hypothetical protein